MSAEDFFSRWARKNEEAQAARPAPVEAPPPPDPYEGRAPTQEDLDKLTPQDNFSAFMKQGVDENVKRSALRKLFSDPHFNIMDGLDIYIDDYTKPDPIPPEMMAMLQHAKGLLDPEGLKEQPVLAMRSEADVAAEGEPAAHDCGDGDSEDTASGSEPDSLAQEPNQHQDTAATEEAPQAAHQPAASSAATHDTSGTDPERETPKP